MHFNCKKTDAVILCADCDLINDVKISIFKMVINQKQCICIRNKCYIHVQHIKINNNIFFIYFVAKSCYIFMSFFSSLKIPKTG